MRAAHKAGPTRPLRVAAPRDTQCAPPRWAEELLPPEQRTGGRLESTAGRAPFGPIWPERSRRRLGEFAHRSRRQRRSIPCRRRLVHPHRAGARDEVIGPGSRPRTPESQRGGRLERGARSTVWRRPPPPSAQSARARTHTVAYRARKLRSAALGAPTGASRNHVGKCCDSVVQIQRDKIPEYTFRG